MTKYKIHPYAEIFPPFSDEEYKALVADIGVNGLREPIILFEGKVLDGVHRYRACMELNREPRVRNYTGNNPLSVAISENLKRRHLNESQRGMVAAKLADMNGFTHGGNRKNQSANLHLEKSNSQAAKELNVSPRTVATAKTVLREAPKREVQAIERGEKSITAVARQIKQKQKNKDGPKDKIGCPIPDDVLRDWREAETFDDLLKQIQRIKLRVSKALDDDELAFCEITNSTVADLHNAWSALQGLIPYAVCPTCEGHNRVNCTLCKQRGYLSKFAYDHFVSKKARELREKLYAA